MSDNTPSDTMSSSQPYLIRALHEWITDNGQTPLIVVDTEYEGVVVPYDYAEDGRLVLNISWTATRHLHMDNDVIAFSARFDGTPYDIKVPNRAVMGIYSRETGQGMVFPEDGLDDGGYDPDDPDGNGTDGPGSAPNDSSAGTPDGDISGGKKKDRPSHLKVVK